MLFWMRSPVATWPFSPSATSLLCAHLRGNRHLHSEQCEATLALQAQHEWAQGKQATIEALLCRLRDEQARCARLERVKKAVATASADAANAIAWAEWHDWAAHEGKTSIAAGNSEVGKMAVGTELEGVMVTVEADEQAQRVQQTAASERQEQPWDRGSSATVTTTTAVAAASQGNPFEGGVVELVATIVVVLFLGFLAMVAILYPVLRYGYGYGQ
jgi:hypothetical protein